MDSPLEVEHRLRPAFRRALDEVQRTAEETYPPYNIERLSENRFRISVALAGETEEAMRPTTALDDNVIDLNAILHPGTIFEHPKVVVSDPDLSLSEKRAILASWASDASAIASCPSLRAPGLKAPVSIDEILGALCALDEGPRNPPGGKPMRLRSVERAAA